MIQLFLINLLLALVWVALTGEFTPTNLLTGFILGYVILWLLYRTTTATAYFQKARLVFSFTFFFLWEMVKANLRVAYEVITPHYTMSPGVVAVPLDATSDAEITLLANLITLTPGTLSLDVSTDRQTLYVHVMFVTDAESFRRQIKEGFERRVMEIFS
jgi:multicomponent Na+:H+ antiporter subunit E